LRFQRKLKLFLSLPWQRQPYCLQHFKLPWSFLWSFIMISQTISEKRCGQNVWKKTN
jgi:hypothetical protein